MPQVAPWQWNKGLGGEESTALGLIFLNIFAGQIDNIH